MKEQGASVRCGGSCVNVRFRYGGGVHGGGTVGVRRVLRGSIKMIIISRGR